MIGIKKTSQLPQPFNVDSIPDIQPTDKYFDGIVLTFLNRICM